MITAINKIKEYKEYAKQLVELSIPIILRSEEHTSELQSQR